MARGAERSGTTASGAARAVAIAQRAAAIAARAAAAGLLLAAAACGPPPPPGDDAACPELPGAVRDRTTPWVFALCDTVDPGHVTAPRNDAEAVVFRHAYEGLTDLDCRGEVAPALAEAWSTPDGGHTWVFTLREDAAFDDGRAVAAGDVVAAWRDTRARAAEQSHRRTLWTGLPLRDADAQARRLTLRLDEADPDLPARLSLPEFFVLRRDEARWPLGTRGRIPGERAVDGGVEISFRDADAGAAEPPVTFRVLPGADPRDAFHADVAALLTRDRRAIRFLAESGGARLTPLRWSRRYALLDPTGAFTWIEGTLPLLRTELVRDVMPGDARAPWDPGRGDMIPPAPTDAFAIRFPRGDPDAAAAAERVASVASRRDAPKRWVVVASPPAAVFGGETPAVVALPPYAFDPRPGQRTPARFPLRGAVYPLAETRAQLATREGLAGIAFGWDGVPRLDDAGFAARAGS